MVGFSPSKIYSSKNLLKKTKVFKIIYDAPPNSLIESTTSLNVKITKRQGVGVHFLARSTSGVERHAKASRWGLR
jgi:hypothetical protein